MNETDRKEKEREELIKNYIEHIREFPESKLRVALLYFLSKDRIKLNSENYSIEIEKNNLIAKRKLFILKVLKECTVSCNLCLSLFPKEVEDKLIEAYETDIKQENEANKAHIAELVAEMNEIF